MPARPRSGTTRGSPPTINRQAEADRKRMREEFEAQGRKIREESDRQSRELKEYFSAFSRSVAKLRRRCSLPFNRALLLRDSVAGGVDQALLRAAVSVGV